MRDEIKDDEFYERNLAQLNDKDSITFANTTSFYRRGYKEPTPKETVIQARSKLEQYLGQFADTSDPRIDTYGVLYDLAKGFVQAYQREHPKAKIDLRRKTFC
ncbi:MAG: hypothetical protein ABI361_11740 [Nitrososphaera sp.]